MRGFTLLELLVTIAVITTLGTAAFGYYRNFGKNVEIEIVSRMLKSDLRRARSGAVSGEDGAKWGVHAVNGADDYYEIFKTSSDYINGTVAQTMYLPSTVIFSEPQEGMARDVLFNKINGTTNAASITITSSNRSITVTITSEGTVY